MRSKIIFMMSAAALSELLIAQTTTAPVDTTFSGAYYDTVALLILLIIAMVAFGFLFFGMGEGKENEAAEKKLSLISKFKQAVTRSVPIERESEIMLDHDFDGIKELDNRIPPWFSWLFYVSIIFAFYYLLNYHVFGAGKLQYEEYAEEMKLAEMQREELVNSGVFINETTVALLSDQQSMESGLSIYKLNCSPCHGPEGGGSIGPNLTDDYWINGGGIKNIFKTIKYGVPIKGMISWQAQLNPRQIQEVASFIISIHGRKPAGGKEPQGEKYIETDSSLTVKNEISVRM